MGAGHQAGSGRFHIQGAHTLGAAIHEDLPTAVILNEAVDLATAFSTDDSGRFANGVLATVATRVRPVDSAC